MTDRLPPGLWVAATIRRAASEGVPIVVRHRGDPDSGSLLIKINLLNGTARVLEQVARDDGSPAWNPLGATDPLPDAEAEACLERYGSFDSDAWILEIEDRRGRLWFTEGDNVSHAP